MKEQTVEKVEMYLVELLLGRYLSDDQRAVFTGRGARVALAFVVNDHGFHRLGLSVAQPGGPAGERGDARSHARPGRPARRYIKHTQPWSPRGQRSTLRPLPDPPPRRRPRRWCPIPRWRTNNPSPCSGGGRRPRPAAPWPKPSGPEHQRTKREA